MVDTAPQRIELLVSGWAEQRAGLLFSNSTTRRELDQQLQQCDDALVRAMTEVVPDSDSSDLLNYAWRTAKQAFAEAVDRSHQHQALAGASARAAIQREINELWQEVGLWRGRPTANAHLEELLQAYDCRRLEYEETLIAQVASVSSEAPHRVRVRVQQTLQRVCEQAARRGEDRYLAAIETAQTLFGGLPGKVSQSDPVVFRTLCELGPAELLDVLEVFQADYHAPVDEMIRVAYASPSVMLKNFLRIPALQTALEEEFGIGVGLWKIDSQPVRAFHWRARLARLKQSGNLLAVAIRQLIPRSFRGWQEYLRQLSTFFSRLSQQANGPELARIEATLQNHHTDIAVHSLFLCLWRGEARVGKLVKGLLQRMNRQQLQEVERRFEASYRPVLGADDLRGSLSKLLPSDEAEHLHALLDGHAHGANAVQFRQMLHGTQARRLELLQWLAQLPPPSVRGLIEAYQRESSGRVDRDFLAHYFDGPLLDWAYYLVSDQPKLAAAARLECALRRLSGEWPGTLFYDQPEARDLAVIEAHGALYQRSFWDHFQRMSGVERGQIMHTLITEGSLSTADQIRHCMIGVGADTEAIKATLSNLSARQNAKLSQAYASQFTRIDWNLIKMLNAVRKTAWRMVSTGQIRSAAHDFRQQLRQPRNLDRDLQANLCGYNRFDVALLRAGKTSNPRLLYARLMQRVAFEQAGAPYCSRTDRARQISTRVLSWLATTPVQPVAKIATLLQQRHPILLLKDRDVDAAVQFYESNIRDQPIGKQRRRRFAMMVRVANRRLDEFREFQNRKAERQANLGALLTSTGAFFGLVSMSLPYIPLAMTVGASSMAGRYLVKTRIKGDGYGEREAARDAFMAIVDGPTLALGQFVKTLRLLQAFGLGRTVLGSAVKMTLTHTVRRWGRARITAALLTSKKSGHARRHLLSQQDALLAEYGRLLQKEREAALDGKRKSVRRSRGIERVFLEIGKQIAARADAQRE